MYSGNFDDEKKNISKLFVVLTLSGLCSYVAVVCVNFLLAMFYPNYTNNGMLQFLVSDFYTVVAIGMFAAFSGGIPSHKPTPCNKMTFASFVKIIVSLIALMIIGAIIGNVMSVVVGSFIGRELTNAVDEVIENYSIYEILLSVVIIAPITEEIFFRKLLIGKTIRYGTTFSVVVSGLVFGAFHGNFYQFFYAAAVGMAFAYIYCVYGKLRYTIIFHSILNFIGSVASVYFANLAQSPYLLDNLAASLYSLLYMATVPFGIVFLVKGIKKMRFYALEGVLVSPSKALVGNVGLIVYIIYALIMFVIGVLI